MRPLLETIKLTLHASLWVICFALHLHISCSIQYIYCDWHKGSNKALPSVSTAACGFPLSRLTWRLVAYERKGASPVECSVLTALWLKVKWTRLSHPRGLAHSWLRMKHLGGAWQDPQWSQGSKFTLLKSSFCLCFVFLWLCENRSFRTTAHCWSSISGIPDSSHFKRVLLSARSFNTCISSFNWYLPCCKVYLRNVPCITLVNASASWAPVWTHRSWMPSDSKSFIAFAWSWVRNSAEQFEWLDHTMICSRLQLPI